MRESQIGDQNHGDEFISQSPLDFWGSVINATIAAYADAPTEVFAAERVTTVIRDTGQTPLSYCYIDEQDPEKVNKAISTFAQLLKDRNTTGGIMFRSPPDENLIDAAHVNGFIIGDSVPHMVLPLAPFLIEDEPHIELATTLDMLRESADVQTPAFGVPAEVINNLKGPKVLENESVRTYNLRNEKGQVISSTIAVHRDRIVTILLMATRPEFQGQDYGSQLLKSVLNRSCEEGLTHANLRTSTAGKPLYDSVGFQTTETHTTLSNKQLI